MKINNQIAPIILFVYNRPNHTQKTLKALTKNLLADESRLLIYSDAPSDVSDKNNVNKIEKVRKLIRSKKWCKEVNIIEREKNYGLAKNIREGVTEVLNKHGKAIVLEDDLVVSPGFLEYMNKALNLYEEEEKVMHVSAHISHTTGREKLPETFFLRFMNCKGWGTWKRAWDKAIWDIDYLHREIHKPEHYSGFTLNGQFNGDIQLQKNLSGEMNTWAVYWAASIFLQGGLCLCPGQSLVQDIGKDGTGVHGINKKKKASMSYPIADHIEVKKTEPVESAQGREYLERFYRYGHKSDLLTRYAKDSKETIKNNRFTRSMFYFLKRVLKSS